MAAAKPYAYAAPLIPVAQMLAATAVRTLEFTETTAPFQLEQSTSPPKAVAATSSAQATENMEFGSNSTVHTMLALISKEAGPKI